MRRNLMCVAALLWSYSLVPALAVGGLMLVTPYWPETDLLTGVMLSVPLTVGLLGYLSVMAVLSLWPIAYLNEHPEAWR